MESLACCVNEEERNDICTDSRVVMKIVVTIVTLGRGSDSCVGRNTQYTRTWPGLKRQNSRRQIGRGSQTASSHTSRCASGCARDSADPAITFAKYRNGEAAIGFESTRTRRADGVAGG